MQQELRLHRIVLVSISMALLLFFLLVVHVNPSLVDERLEAVGALILVLFAAGALIIIGGIEGAVALQFGRRHKTEFVTYLAICTFSLAAGIYLGLTTDASLQALAFIVAPHAFLFGLMQFRMAQHLRHHQRLYYLFTINASLEIASGVALVVGTKLSNRETANLIAAVGVISILQVLPIILYPRRRVSTSSSSRVIS